ncbi:MAG: D-amino acid dehydrogenase [Alphaproteobacteria bacterium]|nr:D-amino acid dehydrogenase [Alphaproteobacteria bacterium]
MKILVLGSGIVGVTAAHFLARDGHEVHVIDRQALAANETSFSNAGMIAPGHAYPWSSPRAPKILWRSLFRGDTSLKLKPSLDPYMWMWCLKFLAQCTAEKAAANARNKVRLCAYSQESLQFLLDETPIDYHRVTGGAVYLYRDPALYEAGVKATKILTDNGVVLQPKTVDEAARIEPALESVKSQLAGVIYSPRDESGDCHLFANKLAQHCTEKRGVTFHWSTAIERIEASGDRVERVVTSKGAMTADAYVLATGSYAPIHARSIGISLPIYPVKGYAVTVPVDGRNRAPRLSGVDEQNLVAWSRLGDRLRLTATAEISGYGTDHKPGDFAHMLKTAQGLFPDGADFARPSYWAGLRPMTPEGTPILGPARYRNLWLNTGQGHMGWTMSFGSARIVADMIAGRKPAIDLTGLTYANA